MPHGTRRQFLKVSGAVIGGIAVGTTVTAAESADRFVVDASRLTKRDLSDVEVVHDLDQIDVAVVRGPESAVRDLGATYAPDLAIRLDEPARARPEPQADARDEQLYPLQWDKQVQDVPRAHEVTRGEGTRVAVIDSGVDAAHPDLAHAVNLALSRNFTGDDYGAGVPAAGYHGTHVAGIIAANDRNDIGTVGTAPATEVVDCRVFRSDDPETPDEDESATATWGDMLAAMVYSAEIGCDAVNMSIGAYPVSREGLGSFYGKVLNATTSYMRRQGTLLVVSAGNDAADLQHDGQVCVQNDDGTVECFPAISLPNEASNCMSISATGPVGYLWGEEGLVEDPESPANYTNYGTNAIDVAAPGGDYDPEAAERDVTPWYYDLVLSTVPGGWGWAAGTSMAAPQVTGAAALVKSVNPEYTANQVRNVLERTAAVPDGYDKAYYGSGFLRPDEAVRE